MRGITFKETITIQSLINEGYYEIDESLGKDSEGRTYIRRTEKGDRAATFWSGEKLHAIATLLQEASHE